MTITGNTGISARYFTDTGVATVTDTASVDLSLIGQELTATVLPAGVNHNALANLTTGDPHTQYAYLAGRAAGQTLSGGTASGENLTLQSTANATKGKVLLGASSAYDEANIRMGIGIASPTATFHVQTNNSSFLLETVAANPISFTMRTANASGDAMTTFENSGDANNSWRAGRIADGTYRIQFSAAQPFSGATNVLTATSTADVGVGTTAPDTRFHVEEDNAVTAGVTRVTRLTHTTSGTPANGIGVGLEFEAETSSNNNEVGAIIDAVTTDVTAGSEDFDLVFRTMSGGAAAAIRARLNDTGLGVGNSPTAGVDIPASTTTRASMRIREGTAPTSPNEGDMWADSTQKAIAMYVDGTTQYGPGVLFTQSADQTVSNTVSETTILGTGIGTKTLPANFFTVGKTVRIRVGGVYSTPAATVPSVLIRVKYGSTTVATVTTTGLLAGATNLEFDGMVMITCRSVGSSGTVVTHGDVKYATGVAGTASTDPLNNSGSTTTINTTQSSALDVTIVWDAATSTRSVKSTVTSIEVLN